MRSTCMQSQCDSCLELTLVDAHFRRIMLTALSALVRMETS